MKSNDPRTILSEITKLLEAGHEDFFAAVVRNALSCPEQGFKQFLVSNELWGGAGSVADQPFMSDPVRRRALQGLLVRLGRLQIDMGNTNSRTEMWVSAFEQWQRDSLL